MARTTSERLRRSLIADMHGKGALSSPGVTAAFLAVAREHFLPEALEGRLESGLPELITQWRALEHAGRTKLRITARGRASPLRMTYAWGESYD